jgi:hypothetical protein
MQIGICRSEQIGIIDLAAFRTLVCWFERHRRKCITEGNLCVQTETPLQFPPAPIASADSDSSGSFVGSGDRSQDEAENPADPFAGRCQSIAEDNQLGGRR